MCFAILNVPINFMLLLFTQRSSQWSTVESPVWRPGTSPLRIAPTSSSRLLHLPTSQRSSLPLPHKPQLHMHKPTPSPTISSVPTTTAEPTVCRTDVIDFSFQLLNVSPAMSQSCHWPMEDNNLGNNNKPLVVLCKNSVLCFLCWTLIKIDLQNPIEFKKHFQ